MLELHYILEVLSIELNLVMILLIITSGRFPLIIDNYGTLYSFANSTGKAYGLYKFPILVNNKDIFNPTFNHMN